MTPTRKSLLYLDAKTVSEKNKKTESFPERIEWGVFRSTNKTWTKTNFTIPLLARGQEMLKWTTLWQGSNWYKRLNSFCVRIHNKFPSLHRSSHSWDEVCDIICFVILTQHSEQRPVAITGSGQSEIRKCKITVQHMDLSPPGAPYFEEKNCTYFQ